MNHSIDEYPEGVGGYTNKKKDDLCHPFPN